MDGKKEKDQSQAHPNLKGEDNRSQKINPQEGEELEAEELDETNGGVYESYLVIKGVKQTGFENPKP